MADGNLKEDDNQNDVDRVVNAIRKQEIKDVAKNKIAALLNIINTVIPLSADDIRDSDVDWEARKDEAVNHIKNASSLLSDPLALDGELDIAKLWEDTSESERTDFHFPPSFDISNPDILMRCIDLGILSYVLDQIAEAISNVASSDLKPYQVSELLLANPEFVGVRGGTKNNNHGRTRALLVRTLDNIVPSNLDGRFALIARLANRRDPSISRHYVRSLLAKGRT